MIFSSGRHPQTSWSRFAAFGVLLAAAALFVTSCTFDVEIGGDGVKGDGDIVTNAYDVPDYFDMAQIEDSFDATIEVGLETSVVVQAHENLFGYIDVNVRGDRLTIKAAGDRDLNGVTNVTITMPALRELDVSGASSAKVLGVVKTEKLGLEISGASEVSFDEIKAEDVDGTISGASDVTIDDVTAGKISLSMSGASDISMQGEAQEAALDVSGASDAKFGRLTVDDAEISVSGASDLDLRNARIVSGDMSGTSSVRVAENASVNVDMSGMSEIRKG